MNRKAFLLGFALLLGLPARNIPSRLVAQSGHSTLAQTGPAQPVVSVPGKGWEYRILSSYAMHRPLADKGPSATLDWMEQQINQAAIQGFEVESIQSLEPGKPILEVTVLLRRPRK